MRLGRAIAAVDSGQAVNPDGIANQIQGGIVQSASWTLYESVHFEPRRILSQDWSTYPILRFGTMPESVDVYVIDAPGEPFLGTGEAAQGPDGRGDRQCRRERDGRAHSRPAAQFGAGEGGNRGLSLA